MWHHLKLADASTGLWKHYHQNLKKYLATNTVFFLFKRNVFQVWGLICQWAAVCHWFHFGQDVFSDSCHHSRVTSVHWSPAGTLAATDVLPVGTGELSSAEFASTRSPHSHIRRILLQAALAVLKWNLEWTFGKGPGFLVIAKPGDGGSGVQLEFGKPVGFAGSLSKLLCFRAPFGMCLVNTWKTVRCFEVGAK